MRGYRESGPVSQVDAPADLRARLAESRILVAPGCYDALSACLVERTGFECAYLSGASIAYTRLGRPDVGLFGLETVASVLESIRERVSIPLIVDADTGFGNALNVQRTVRVLEARGASAIQLEDQQMPKRCGHLAGKSLVSAAEMVGKIRAACDARASATTLVVARTDAVAVDGLEAAIERAARYAEAGADVLFVEALPDLGAMRSAVEQLQGCAPLLANMVEGGRTPSMSCGELEALGFSLAIFPGSLVRIQTAAALACLESLQRDGTTIAVRDRMLDFRQLNALMETDALLTDAARYDPDRIT
jgi:2-methylisocitrate lyase-like PEP mutase family enzyme